MKNKYKLQREGRGFLIAPIEENMVRFASRILSCKLLYKMRPADFTTGMIEIAEQCVAGLIFNWLQFLLKKLIDDVEQVQGEPRAKFHYS